MEIAPVSSVEVQTPMRPPAQEKVERARREPSLALVEPKTDAVTRPQEEILSKIQALTEDGLYSVRFEKHRATNALIIKLVDQGGEVIRQIPAEEILALSERLDELRGNVIKTES